MRPHTVTLAGNSASNVRSAIAAARSAAYEAAGFSKDAVAQPSTVVALSTREKQLLDDFHAGKLLADLETLHQVTIMVRQMTTHVTSISHPRGGHSGVQLSLVTCKQAR